MEPQERDGSPGTISRRAALRAMLGGVVIALSACESKVATPLLENPENKEITRLTQEIFAIQRRLGIADPILGYSHRESTLPQTEKQKKTFTSSRVDMSPLSSAIVVSGEDKSGILQLTKSMVEQIHPQIHRVVNTIDQHNADHWEMTNATDTLHISRSTSRNREDRFPQTLLHEVGHALDPDGCPDALYSLPLARRLELLRDRWLVVEERLTQINTSTSVDEYGPEMIYTPLGAAIATQMSYGQKVDSVDYFTLNQAQQTDLDKYLSELASSGKINKASRDMTNSVGMVTKAGSYICTDAFVEHVGRWAYRNYIDHKLTPIPSTQTVIDKIIGSGAFEIWAESFALAGFVSSDRTKVPVLPTTKNKYEKLVVGLLGGSMNLTSVGDMMQSVHRQLQAKAPKIERSLGMTSVRKIYEQVVDVKNILGSVDKLAIELNKLDKRFSLDIFLQKATAGEVEVSFPYHTFQAIDKRSEIDLMTAVVACLLDVKNDVSEASKAFNLVHLAWLITLANEALR